MRGAGAPWACIFTDILSAAVITADEDAEMLPCWYTMVQGGNAKDGESSRSRSRGASPRVPHSAGARSGGRPPTPAATSRLGGAPLLSATGGTTSHVPSQDTRPQTAPLQPPLPRLALASVGRPPNAAYSPAGSSDISYVTTPNRRRSTDCVTSPLRPAMPSPAGGSTRGSPIVERNQRRNNLRRRRSIECGALPEVAPARTPPSGGGVWMGLRMPPPPLAAGHSGEVGESPQGEGLSSRQTNTLAASESAPPHLPPPQPIASYSDSDDGLSASSSGSDEERETASVASHNTCRFAFPSHLAAVLRSETPGRRIGTVPQRCVYLILSTRNAKIGCSLDAGEQVDCLRVRPARRLWFRKCFIF